jgi:hypothetical protein
MSLTENICTIFSIEGLDELEIKTASIFFKILTSKKIEADSVGATCTNDNFRRPRWGPNEILTLHSYKQAAPNGA